LAAESEIAVRIGASVAAAAWSLQPVNRFDGVVRPWRISGSWAETIWRVRRPRRGRGTSSTSTSNSWPTISRSSLAASATSGAAISSSSPSTALSARSASLATSASSTSQVALSRQSPARFSRGRV
jgi:hypothetical protein